LDHVAATDHSCLDFGEEESLFATRMSWHVANVSIFFVFFLLFCPKIKFESI
jgi:hypothetical protein